MKQEFFELLYRDRDFCKSLGQVMLASSKLERVLHKFLANEGHSIKENPTLGQLILIIKQKRHLSNNGKMVCEELKLQRNYLSHRLYELFDKEIQKKELPRLPCEGLVPEDVEIFTEKASQTASDFYEIARIIIDRIDQGNLELIDGKKILL